MMESTVTTSLLPTVYLVRTSTLNRLPLRFPWLIMTFGLKVWGKIDPLALSLAYFR